MPYGTENRNFTQRPCVHLEKIIRRIRQIGDPDMLQGYYECSLKRDKGISREIYAQLFPKGIEGMAPSTKCILAEKNLNFKLCPYYEPAN